MHCSICARRRKYVDAQECRSSLAAAKAEVVRLRRAVAVEKQRADGAAGDFAALADERVLRQGAEAAAQGAKAALAAKADLVKDLRTRVGHAHTKSLHGSQLQFGSGFACLFCDHCAFLMGKAHHICGLGPVDCGVGSRGSAGGGSGGRGDRL